MSSIHPSLGSHYLCYAKLKADCLKGHKGSVLCRAIGFAPFFLSIVRMRFSSLRTRPGRPAATPETPSSGHEDAFAPPEDVIEVPASAARSSWRISKKLSFSSVFVRDKRSLPETTPSITVPTIQKLQSRLQACMKRSITSFNLCRESPFC